MKLLHCAFERKLERYIQLDTSELAGVERLKANPRSVKRNTEIVEEGTAPSKMYLIHEGWVRCYKLLPDGERQIVTFPIAGDFIGMRSSLLARSDHSAAAITDLLVTEFDQSDFREIFLTSPHLFSAILWTVSRDEAMIVEHLVDIGRRSALERMAHFVLELSNRVMLITPRNENRFDCPLTQFDLADALGLSAIHVNRTFRTLRERGLMTFRNGVVEIENQAGLEDLAGYQPEVFSKPTLFSDVSR